MNKEFRATPPLSLPRPPKRLTGADFASRLQDQGVDIKEAQAVLTTIGFSAEISTTNPSELSVSDGLQIGTSVQKSKDSFEKPNTTIISWK